ncbi:hypothetical protein LTR62_000034 [Meristemomyces frigidus]|uniref:Cyclin N-terminal domain-containing protein n=1 Tax=Meristemomyces frigidus TaxID=1508187 RepID=A0AAN7YJZ1_9PEZI|nr:hypothetical protein LTR62_000034 [Meristemomyces frigidus]
MAYCIPTTAQNAAALDHFIYMPVSQEMIAFLAAKAANVIRCEGQVQLNQNLPPTPPTTPPQYAYADPMLPSLELFITALVARSHVQVPTLMSSLVYLSRLQQRLPPVAKGMKCTSHRIFLAALILAAKNLNDSSPKNKHWARYTAVPGFETFGFSLTEVNLMEKQLLGLLDWDLRITENDLFFHLEPFLGPIRSWQSRQAEKQRIREDMAALEQQRQLGIAVELQRQAALQSARFYDSPRQYADVSAYPTMYYPASSAGSSRAPSRTPSLSPPTRSRSAASYSSNESYASSCSPASIASSYIEPVCEDYPVQIQQYDGHKIPTMVHIPAATTKHTLTALPLPHALPLDMASEQPLKKQKTSNIFSRFLPTMNKSQITGY